MKDIEVKSYDECPLAGSEYGECAARAGECTTFSRESVCPLESNGTIVYRWTGGEKKVTEKHKHCSLGMCIKKHERITCHPEGIQCEYYISKPKER